MIEELLPPPVASAEHFGDAPLGELFPEEAASVASTVAARRAKFRTVRSCARTALAQLGIPAVPIPRGPRGEPIWPDGIVFLLRFSTAFLLAGSVAPVRPAAFACGAAAWTCATTYVYLVNGVHDAPEDRLNANGRPISGGRLAPERARAIARVLALLALLLAALGPVPLLTPLVAAQLLCGYAYSAPRIALKRRTATAVPCILALGGLTFAAGWLCAGADRRDALPVLVLGTVLTLWMGAVGAPVKDLSDLRGDAAAGRRTALIRGCARRARLICAINPLVLGAAYTAVAATATPVLLPSALLLLGGALAIAVLTATTSSSEPRGRSRLPYRAFMVTQYAACAAALCAALTR
ncbi:UbiA family prenyltransferase [Streptomyces sp. A1-5]|uniref:UbiA family prenyltransferase n=1 Tax=Streptomyces sp. A1-5 TaxID=2738410 RepID=UPI002E24E8EC